MAITIDVEDFQQGFAEVAKQLQELTTNKIATVGIHEDAGMVEGQPGLTEASLGATHEFGLGVPARPWLEPGFEQAIPDVLSVVYEGLDGGLELDQILEQVGAIAAGEVQQYVVDLRTPPNAPYTIAKKGSDNPLIDTGRMLGSITYVVGEGPMVEGLE